MKKLIYSLPFVITVFLIIYNCTTEEENTTSSTVQQSTPGLEPESTQFNLTVTSGEGGSVSTEGGTYDEGTEVSVTATPAEGYEFDRWIGIDSETSTLNLTLNENKEIMAYFIKYSPFSIELESIDISGLVGVQSYAFGQYENKWLVIGGRLDGLHQRQPSISFSPSGNNRNFIVIDPISKQVWSKSFDELNIKLQDQLSSTNMEFYQEEDNLILIGGYGYSESIGNHTTFPYLTVIDIPKTIEAVISKAKVEDYIQQLEDQMFQVTGGKLKKMGAEYYLLGGQKFIGRYNPMGPQNGQGFTQEYTNAIRKFKLEENQGVFNFSKGEFIVDAELFHRRDYNAEAQILPNGNQAITMFSGVFKKTENLPFLNAVSITDSGYDQESNFSQYFNHYHCAVIPLYSESKNEMNTLFFGGIAQFYEEGGKIIQDNNVPFVKTITRVCRDAEGRMSEVRLKTKMEDFLGSGSEFIPNENLKKYSNGVLDFDAFETATTDLGYIFGGIQSSDKNIFFINTGSESIASSRIYKVLLHKK